MQTDPQKEKLAAGLEKVDQDLNFVQTHLFNLKARINKMVAKVSTQKDAKKIKELQDKIKSI